MDLLSLLLGSMTQSSSVNSVSQKTGVSNDMVKKLLILALPLIIKYMTSNASSQSGASSLLGALTQHSNKKSIPEQLSTADADDGRKIIGHIFGDNTQDVIGQLAGNTGMSDSDVSSVLSNIAPALMSSLSATTQAESAAQSAGSPFDLGSVFGGSDLLSGIFGQQPAAPQGGGGLLQTLLGAAAPAANDTAQNGGDLLSALLGLK